MKTNAEKSNDYKQAAGMALLGIMEDLNIDNTDAWEKLNKQVKNRTVTLFSLKECNRLTDKAQSD